MIRFDQNGYNNANGDLDKSYILLMGSSQVEGLQFAQEKNMTAVLNQYLGGTKEHLRAYNMAISANFLPQIVKGFQAGISEFPDSEAVIIEVGSTSFRLDDLQNSMDQTVYDPASNGTYLAENLTAEQKLTGCIKQALPYVRLIMNKQLKNIDLFQENPFGLDPTSPQKQEEAVTDTVCYGELLDEVFGLLREEYDKPIIIFYHPKTAFYRDGITMIREDETYDIFKEACEKNDIFFADMGEAFVEAYETDYTVPYGFANTEMGQGHLNADGHAIIAQQLYQILIELPEVQ